MSKTNTGGAAADLSSLSHDELLEMLRGKMEADAKRERLAGVTIERVQGVSKAGKSFDVLQLKGGELGWRGMNLTPAKWGRLKSLTDEIDAAMAEHWPDATI